MTKTKLLAIVLAFVLVISIFAACGKKADKPDVTENTTASTSTTVTVKADKDVDATITVEADETTTLLTKAVDNTTTTKKQGSAVGTTKAANKPSATKAQSSAKVTTTAKAANVTKPAKPITKPTENQFGYFKASTSEQIRYETFDVDYGYVTAVEKNGIITFTCENGVQDFMTKCDICGKYLCEGCLPVVADKCPYCGKATCERYSKDVNCLFCGQFVKADTCHDCPKSPRR